MRRLLAAAIALAVLAAGALAAPRDINVHFRARVDTAVPVDFGPTVPAVRVRLGETKQVTFRFTNLSGQAVTFQAAPKLEPAAAAASFHQLQGFCMTRQVLKPNETRMMPVQFRIDPTLSRSVPEVYLGVTLSRVPARP